ncbi:MAG: YkgJ family cysteine cluster protein [Deltaproteobacteria bacterium]|nr:YkgJ family cysteine cluster protein [Deltaproteobacteria bacterium]
MIHIARFPVQALLWVWEYILEGFERLSYKIQSQSVTPQYKRLGQCQGTGNCCEGIGIKLPKPVIKNTVTKEIAKKWYGFRFNFEFIKDEEEHLIYNCRYLKENRRCQIYRFRPKLCRDHPKQLAFGKSHLAKGCGYHYESTRKNRIRSLVNEAKEADKSFKV